MAKNTNLNNVMLRQELFLLTEDKTGVEALILNQAVYYNKYVEKMDQPMRETIQSLKDQGKEDVVKELEKTIRDGWFYKSANDIYKEIMITSRPTVHRRLESLTEKGYLIKGGKFLFDDIKGAGDRNWWKLNKQKLRRDLHKIGCTLFDHKVWSDEDERDYQENWNKYERLDPVHSEQPPVHGEQPKLEPVHSEQPPVHGEQHHRKRTQESLSKDTIKDQSIKEEEIEKEPKQKPDRLIDLSIKNDINNLQIPNQLKNTLLKYITTIEKYSVPLKEIELLYTEYKDLLTDIEINQVLHRVCTAKNIEKSFIGYLRQALTKDYLKKEESQAGKSDDKAPQADHNNPEWYKQGKHKEKPQQPQKETPYEEMSEEQKEVADRIRELTEGA